MSWKFLRAGMLLKIPEMHVSVPDCRFRRWRSESTDARDARFSRIFDACRMHRRRNIIYILCVGNHANWKPSMRFGCSASWEMHAAGKRCLHDSLPTVENVLYEMVFVVKHIDATSLFEREKSHSLETVKTAKTFNLIVIFHYVTLIYASLLLCILIAATEWTQKNHL